ncbi:ABC transporter permease [Umezawaea sp. Da 62-37]|uniref:ABC transporter permease n=1 Tax=Umezawaea sp. Da 62-37 TaxID=3075927 RepID=UPI0028F6E572|nr:ABC transporter permease [Umezawaea sp. Da 62-37]WNV85783.1 ABC transporter permease [Umezawaea sp. Da 62-37]
MSTATLTAPTAPAAIRAGVVDNRATYISFGLAYVLGHGAAALSKGADPLVALPGWLPMTLLGIGLAAGSVHSTIAAMGAQRGASKSDALSGTLLGISWAGGFAALFLAITGLTSIVDVPDLQTILWPTGSGLVVGLLYLGEGAVRRNVLHYCLGTWLALTSSAALFLHTSALFGVLAVAGGGGYAVAALLERKRLNATA